ncbi:MAG: AmmeMemoRadiSam system protein B [Candidatus Hydrogenedentes bacterium]|nr:AmmeMemoRadiSam system protein B [Candidatus Hydrogenedentota bacterium]
MKRYFLLAGLVAACAVILGLGPIPVREPVGVGILYPPNAAPLRAAVEQYMTEADIPELPAPVVAVISPHASFPASGAISAAGFKSLKKGQYSRVVIIAPAMASKFRGGSIPDVQYFRTPLGDVPLDGPAIRRLTMSSVIELRAVVYRADAYLDPDVRRVPLHEKETAIELMLPFLQVQLGKFKLVPIVFGDFPAVRGGGIDEKLLAAAARAIRPILDENTLLVVCSDLTRYGVVHNFTPFNEDILKHIGELDIEAINAIQSMDYRTFMDYLERTKNPISGAMPIAVMLQLLPKSARGILMGYDVSGRMTGNLKASVSFASIDFIDIERPPFEAPASEVTPAAEESTSGPSQADEAKKDTQPAENPASTVKEAEDAPDETQKRNVPN